MERFLLQQMEKHIILITQFKIITMVQVHKIQNNAIYNTL